MQSLALSFSSFGRYLRQPVYQIPLADKTDRSMSSNLRQFTRESALFLFLLGCAVTLSLEYTQITGHHFFQTLIERYRTPWDILTLAMATVLAVILEEAVFRSILRLTPTRLRNIAMLLSFVLINATGYKLLKEQYGIGVGLWLFPVWVVFAWGLTKLLKRPAVFARIDLFWQQHFKLIFYVTGLLYTLSKTSDDFANLTVWQWLVVPVTVGTSLLYSFYFGYVRMKFGFWYAVAVHSLILGSILLSQAIFTW